MFSITKTIARMEKKVKNHMQLFHQLPGIILLYETCFQTVVKYLCSEISRQKVFNMNYYEKILVYSYLQRTHVFISQMSSECRER